MSETLPSWSFYSKVRKPGRECGQANGTMLGKGQGCEADMADGLPGREEGSLVPSWCEAPSRCQMVACGGETQRPLF